MWSVHRVKPVQPSSWRRGDARGHRRLLLEELEGRTLPSTGAIPAILPAGYSPSQIRHAYGFDLIKFSGGTIAGTGAGQTIAIVDAYNDSHITNDLSVFDATFKLPAPPKFTRIGETGGALPTQTNAGWLTETSLDVEWGTPSPRGEHIARRSR